QRDARRAVRYGNRGQSAGLPVERDLGREPSTIPRRPFTAAVAHRVRLSAPGFNTRVNLRALTVVSAARFTPLLNPRPLSCERLSPRPHATAAALSSRIAALNESLDPFWGALVEAPLRRMMLPRRISTCPRLWSRRRPCPRRRGDVSGRGSRKQGRRRSEW